MFLFGVMCGLGGGLLGILLYYLFCKYMEWVDAKEVEKEIYNYWIKKNES